MFFPVASSAVIRASYAADLVVSDPIGCIRAATLGGFIPKGTPQFPQSIGSPNHMV